MNFMAMEYPGYGLYTGMKANEDQIKEDAETVYAFIINSLHKKQNDILVFGRSIGTGPACHIASKYEPLALILMSPF